jgi:prepilin-type N-terminal cleavage/methylation domain-containing protein
MVRPRSRQAFTMIEMLLVLAVVGALSAMILPGVSEAAADNRQAGAAEELMRVHRIIRSRVNQTGLAHLMVFTEADVGNHGSFRVFEGMNNRCVTTPWADVNDNDHTPVERVDMAQINRLDGSYSGSANSDEDRQVITLRAATLAGGTATPQSVVNMCLQPNGMTYVSFAAGSFNFQLQSTPIQFTLRRTVNDITHGVSRRVIFPVGGNARLRL